jgi:hypothetical protein
VERAGAVTAPCEEEAMPDRIPQDDIEARLIALEQLVQRLLLIIGAAGAMFAEVRRPIGEE